LVHRANLDGLGSPVTTRLLGVLIFYGFIYTPIVGYVSARMEGVVGQNLELPYIREAVMMLTGYRGVAIWFAPISNNNYGNQALYFRKTELTGTKISSMIKAELFIFPIVFVGMIVFSQFIWKIAPVPSSAFPYAQKWWELAAYRQGLIFSSTLPGGEYGPFAQAFHPGYLVTGLVAAVAVYALLATLGLPVLFFYGLIRGLDQSAPQVILPQFVGALLGRYYFEKNSARNGSNTSSSSSPAIVAASA